MGAPNLTHPQAFIYGSSFAQLQQTIRYGRQGQMPAQELLQGNDKVHLLAGLCLQPVASAEQLHRPSKAGLASSRAARSTGSLLFSNVAQFLWERTARSSGYRRHGRQMTWIN
jgi:hypothetical protein